jgi:hypothetical protein
MGGTKEEKERRFIDRCDANSEEKETVLSWLALIPYHKEKLREHDAEIKQLKNSAREHEGLRQSIEASMTALETRLFKKLEPFLQARRKYESFKSYAAVFGLVAVVWLISSAPSETLTALFKAILK